MLTYGANKLKFQGTFMQSHFMQNNAARDIGTEQVGLMAAIDLGSNSFHMLIAELVDGRLAVVQRQGEKIQLAAGLDKNRYLSDQVMHRALKCLEGFADKLIGIPREHIRVVGTDALRRAANRDEFMVRAAAKLGVPIEVISGEEEARLIYQGALAARAVTDESVLVLDIGGGSTEFALGKGKQVNGQTSLQLGCIEYSRRFFPELKTDRKTFDHAVELIGRQLRQLPLPFKARNWQQVIGTSGSMQAIENVLLENGWAHKGIDRRGLSCLIESVCRGHPLTSSGLRGLTRDRNDIFIAGVAIVTALFNALGLERMLVSQQALKEGLIYSMIN